MSKTPGTVSKILWHFTGGPGWDADKDRQKGHSKSEGDSFNALIGILDSKKLRESSYAEVIRGVMQSIEMVAPDQFEVVNRLTPMPTSGVVCVADIPLQHLAYHSNRYGKFAIGFKRNSLLEAGFNPVHYFPEKSFLAGTAVNLMSDFNDARQIAEEIESEIIGFSGLLGANSSQDRPFGELYSQIIQLKSLLNRMSSRNFAQAHMMKSFSIQEIDQILPEREWRLGKSYNFSLDDVALITLPRENEWFEKLLERIPALPRQIPVVPWEDLIEH